MLGHQVLQLVLLVLQLFFGLCALCAQLCYLCGALCFFVLHLLHAALQVHYRCICYSHFLFRVKLAALPLLVVITHLFQYQFLLVKCLAFFIHRCPQCFQLGTYPLQACALVCYLLFRKRYRLFQVLRLPACSGQEVAQVLLALLQMLQALCCQLLIAFQLAYPVHQFVKLFLQYTQLLLLLYHLHLLLLHAGLFCGHYGLQLCAAVGLCIVLFVQRLVLFVKVFQACLGQFYAYFFVFPLYIKVAFCFLGLAFQCP